MEFNGRLIYVGMVLDDHMTHPSA